MNVIAKMGVQSITDFGYNREIKFQCVYDGSVNTGDDPENRSFTKATPSGDARMVIDNQAVWDAFHAGGPEHSHQSSQHYVVFIDCSKHSLEDVYRALGALDE